MGKIRVVKLEKYMKIKINDSLIKDKIDIPNISNLHIVSIDFSMDANIFYGIRQGCQICERIFHAKDFNDYDVVMRLANWNRDYYCFRILKTNVNGEVNFDEERKYLNSFIQIF